MAVPAPRPRVALAPLVALVALALAGSARAQPEPPAPDELVKLRAEWHELQARRAVAEDAAKDTALPRASTAAALNLSDPNAVLVPLRIALQKDYGALAEAGKKLGEAAETRRAEARAAWDELYRQRVEFRAHVDQQQTAYDFDFDTGSLPAFKPTLIDAGAVIFAVAVRLGKGARRVRSRRLQRSAAAVVLFALLTAPGCSGGAPADARPWAAREAEKLSAENKEAIAAVAAAEAAANVKWNAALESWVKLVTPKVGGEPVDKVVREGETNTRDLFRSAALAARLADRFADEANSERSQLATDKTKLGELTSGAKWRALAYTVARCTGAAVLFVIAIWPFVRARRAEAAAIRADARKCPRCFGTKLVVEKTAAAPGTGDDDEARPSGYKKGGKGAPKEKPKAEAPKESGYVECKTCGFRFLRSYQKVRRLCFPVVGVRASGKTQMLATGYDRVRRRTAPTCAVVQPAPSLGDKRFEAFIDEIMNMKRATAATFHDMPDPVMLHVRDADASAPNTVLVNLFDYSGELVNQSIDIDRLKKQAVQMDGFMLFLDPTQLYGDGVKVTLDRQLAALNEFMADMREARNVPVGQVIPVPVAVCITKFDLLLNENPIQGQCVPFIRRMLSEFNPPQPKQTDLATVQGRSAIVEQMLELMFPGVDIRELVESYFGPQMMFFPVSSVSLFENELGVTDMTRRTIAPFGVAEPFLWLLHMHGYEVFE
jgi:hypothetical protein